MSKLWEETERDQSDDDEKTDESMPPDESVETLLQYNVKLSLFIFDYYSLYTADWFQLYTLYCKLWRCIGQTPCSFEHYLVS